MAVKTFTVLKDMRHPRYSHRMLTAGDQVQLDDPQARLHTALGTVRPCDADGSGRIIQPAIRPKPQPKAQTEKKAATKTAVSAMSTKNTNGPTKTAKKSSRAKK